MATSFNKRYTEITNINSGNQLQDGDVVEVNPVNCAIQNTAHLKELTNNMVVRNVVLQYNKLYLTLATKGNNSDSATTTTLSLEAGDINGLEQVKEIVGSDGFTYTTAIRNYGDYVNIFVYGERYDEEEQTTESYSHTIKIDKTSVISETTENGNAVRWNLRIHPVYLKLEISSGTTLEAYMTLQLPVKNVTDLINLEPYVPDKKTISMTGTYKHSSFGSDICIVAGIQFDKANNKAKIIYHNSSNNSLIESGWIDYSNFTVTSSSINY